MPTFSNKYINIRTYVATCIPFSGFYLQGPNLFEFCEESLASRLALIMPA